jgi:hypothetical protein
MRKKTRRPKMLKKLSVITVVILLSLNLAAQDTDGKALIDKLNAMFKNMAEKPNVSETETASGLESLLAEAKKERDQKQIDPAFFKRYCRVLMILRLMVMPGKQGVLFPVFQKEFGSFAEDIDGVQIDISKKEAISDVVTAVVNEIMDLYLYSDHIKARAKLLKEFEKKYGVRK